MTCRAKQKHKFKKHNQRRPDSIEIVIKDGFSRRKLDSDHGNLEGVLKRQLGRLDEKYDLMWDKILPENVTRMFKHGRKK